MTGAAARDAAALYGAALQAHHAGQAERAAGLYRQALGLDPQHAEAHVNLGAVLLGLQQPEEAIASYRAALEADPFVEGAHGPLGMALSATGAYAEACQHLEIALADAPGNPDLLCYLGDAQLALRHPAAAAASYQAASAADPAHADAALGAGVALREAGQPAAALEWLRRARDLRPDDDAVCSELGSTLLAAEHHEEALALFAELATHADAPGVANNLALALEKTGDPLGGIVVLEAALGRHPEHANGWNTIGCMVFNLDRERFARRAAERAEALAPGCALELAVGPDDAPCAEDATRRFLEDLAERRRRADTAPGDAAAWRALAACLGTFRHRQVARYAFERAIALAPEEPEGWINLANLHLHNGDNAAAVGCVQRVFALCPDQPARLLAVAGQFENLQAIEAALRLYERVLAVDPANRKAASRILHLTLANCDWSDYEGLVARTLQRVEADIAANRQLAYVIFNLLALPIPHAFVDRVARHQSACVAADVRAQAPHATGFVHRPRDRERIRVGYLLPYTFFHSMPLVLKEIVERHDRSRFEVFGYSVTRSDGTPFCAEFRAAFERFGDVTGADAHAAARAIHHDEVDILVDTTGQTPISCLPVMSLRPAPVQAHAIGFGLSTGADYIDYLISDRTFMPPDAQRWCTERLVHMPDCFLPAFLRPAEAGDEDRREHGLPADGVVFMNFNEAVKFEPRMFEVWMRILRAVPESVLWLGTWHLPVQANLRREAAARGIDGERLVFAKIVKHARHARRIRLADLALDNLHHGGGVTSIDALSAGVPLVTIRGDTPQSRLGATLSQAAGFPDLVVESLEAYEGLAIDLARDRGRREGLRSKLLAARSEAPLFDLDRYRRHLELAYETMWSRHLAGQPPAAFAVPSLG